MAKAPDEVSHLWVVKFITEHLRLPNHGDVLSGGLEAVYGPLPQAGYLPHILISKLLPFSDVALTALTARFGSLVMGISLVWIAYFLARELYPKNRLAGLILPTAIVFHPQMVFVDAYTNCDVTAATASSLIFLLVVRMIRHGLNLWSCCAVGLLSGLAVLSKYAALSVVGAALLGLIAAGWLNGASLGAIVASVGLALSALALSCNWWFVRELHEYPNDLLGTKTMRSIWAVATDKPLEFDSGLWSVISRFGWWRMVYFSFWGLFDNMDQYLPKPIYVTYLAFTLAAIAGGVSKMKEIPKLFNLAMGRLKLKDNQDTSEENLELLKYSAIYKMFAISIFINLAAMIWSESHNLGGAQGRYLFCNELPVFALTIGGLAALSEKYSKRLLWAFLAFSIFVYGWSFVLLASNYGFHTNPYYYVPKPVSKDVPKHKIIK
jgi:4-amino-4-deoxy-L-arabinose transferase-like glycosyltransferase